MLFVRLSDLRLFGFVVSSSSWCLGTLLQEGISEPDIYGDLVIWFCLFPLSLDVWEGLRFVIVELPGFSVQFRKLINRYKRIGYSLDIMRQTACQHNGGSGLRLNDGLFVKLYPVGWA